MILFFKKFLLENQQVLSIFWSLWISFIILAIRYKIKCLYLCEWVCVCTCIYEYITLNNVPYIHKYIRFLNFLGCFPFGFAVVWPLKVLWRRFHRILLSTSSFWCFFFPGCWNGASSRLLFLNKTSFREIQAIFDQLNHTKNQNHIHICTYIRAREFLTCMCVCAHAPRMGIDICLGECRSDWK